MDILFLTMSGNMKSLDAPGIYTDLLRQFVNEGHRVYAVAPAEQTSLLCGDGWKLLKVKTDRKSGGNLIRKGLGQLRIRGQFQRAISRHFQGLSPDLILYTTPPITLAGLIAHLKKTHNAATYLLLKDIFPQNAVDLGMMTKRGLKAPIYWFFRRKEKKLYAVSDRIGCMSQANVDYVLRQNPEIDPATVEICPNSVQVQDLRVSTEVRNALRTKYGIPLDKKVFVYGGNLGKPQGIPFIMECLKTQRNHPDAFFLIVGGGTEYKKLEAFFSGINASNMKLMARLPKEDYDQMVAACDVGMIFLDHRFTIPNFPSRLLSYMQAGLPVLCCTDPNTDIGKVCVEGGFGWWCESNSAEDFRRLVDEICGKETLSAYRDNAAAYLQDHYTVQDACAVILADGKDCAYEAVKA